MARPTYVSVNELDTFHFHDACLEDIRLEGQKLIWTVIALNVTQANSQNPDGPDQRVDAVIQFEAGKIAELVFPSYQHSNSKVKNVTVPEKKVSPQQFGDVLDTLLTKPCYILELEELSKTSDGYLARFFVSGQPSCLAITVRFRNVTVTWERFEGPAWYVNWPQRRSATLRRCFYMLHVYSAFSVRAGCASSTAGSWAWRSLVSSSQGSSAIRSSPSSET